MEIQKTTDYRKFKFLKENRDPKHWKKILGSIKKKDMTKYKPIVVDKNFNIIDGQGTFLACKELKKPIYYVQGENIGSDDLAQLNNSQVKWNYDDYLNHYCARKFPEYLKVKALIDETGFKISEIIRLWRRDQPEGMRCEDAYTGGLYNFPPEAIERARSVKTVYQKILDNFPKDKKLTNPSSLIGGIITTFNVPGFELDEMLRVIDKCPYLIEPKRQGAGYSDMLLRMYNRDKPRKNHIGR